MGRPRKKRTKTSNNEQKETKPEIFTGRMTRRRASNSGIDISNDNNQLNKVSVTNDCNEEKNSNNGKEEVEFSSNNGNETKKETNNNKSVSNDCNEEINSNNGEVVEFNSNNGSETNNELIKNKGKEEVELNSNNGSVTEK